MDKQHPHQARLDARDYPYQNVMAEREALRAIDNAVFDRVHQFEKVIVARAEEHKVTSRERVKASLDVIAQLRSEVIEPLRNGAALTPDLAKRYEDLAFKAGKARAALSRSIAESEWHERRCEDPYTAYSNVMSMWPVLRPSL